MKTINLQAYVDEYQAVEVPEMGFDGLDEAAEYERAEAMAELALGVLAVARELITSFRDAALSIRPEEVSDEWDHDDELNSTLADGYDECARDVERAFGLMKS
jgi:hypothetical protein